MDRIFLSATLESVLREFGVETDGASVISIQQGLINHTWKVISGNEEYILQKINQHIFKQPEDVAQNISLIATYLEKNDPAYLFTQPLKTKSGGTIYKQESGNFYRAFHFIRSSHTKDCVDTAGQAYEAARQFGKFTSSLVGFDPASLKITIPNFHNLTLRYQQFLEALVNGNTDRINASQELINRLKARSYIVEKYEVIKLDPAFKLRVTHHDTKISNVLFDDNDKGICVIDLDTIMPGYFISDVGDMFRTYLCQVTEEETDLSKIVIRPDVFNAIVKGYLDEMRNELSEKEQQHFFYAGNFMIYMQALRFMTDHLNNDVYYKASYNGHNYQRAANQARLLEQFINFEKTF